jgi:soluble lytic murein transglycosylase
MRKRLWIYLAFAAAAVFLSLAVSYHVFSNLFFPEEYRPVVKKYSAEYSLDPLLVSSIIYTESHYDPSAVSPKRAVGLMQVLPETAEFIVRKNRMDPALLSDLKNPEHNIKIGCSFFRYLVDRFHGDERLALAAYNAGMTNVTRWKEAGNENNADEIIQSRGFDETKNYVVSVEKIRGYLRKLNLIKSL